MRSSLLLPAVALGLANLAQAETPQSLSATVTGEAFVSDDDSINLIPVPMAGNFTLIASTKGASSYPPPKTRIDRLSISCSIDDPPVPMKLDNKAFQPDACRVTFSKGTKPMGGDPDVEYTLDKTSADNRFEVRAVRGKVLEGSFHFQLKDPAGAAITISNGAFVAEDRQL